MKGLNVREKSKALAALLADEERLKEERKTRAALRERMGGPVSPTYSTGPSSSGTPRTQSEEQRQLERALEESRATAAEHERKQKAREKEERELQRAIEETKREHQQKQVQAVDLWGAAPEADQRKQDLDFFSSMATTAPVQQSQPDPFGFGSFGQSGSGAGAVVAANPFGAPQHTGPAAFGGAATSGMFQQQSSFASFQQPTQQTQQGNMFGGNPQFAASTPSFAQPAQQQQLSARMLPPSGGFGGQASSSTAATPSFNFDSAFDTGAGQKSFVPRHLQGQANPAAQIAQIARNSSQIDPFASMANRPGSGSTAAPSAPSNTSGWSTAVVAGPQASAAANPFGGKSTAGAADPFASLAPLSKPPSAAQNQPQQPKTLAGMGGASTASFGGGNYGIASVQAQPLQSQQSFQTGAQNPFGGAATGAMFGAPATQQQKSPFGQAQQQPQQQQQPAASQQQNFFF